MSFGEMIRKYRREKGFTQEQLADLLNVTPQAVSRWENHSAMPDISLLVPLANVLKVSTDTLLEVNVEETEKQVSEIIRSMLEIRNGDARVDADRKRTEILREGIRRFPQELRLKGLLLGVLADMDLQSYPDTDPTLLREEISLAEDIAENTEDREEREEHLALLSSLHSRLDNTERPKQLAEDAPSMRSCREVLLPASLRGKEQVRARKDLMFQCTDQLISVIHDLFRENAADLTEEEWQELNQAAAVVETVYGKSFSDCFILTDQAYSRVHGAAVRGNTEEAVGYLEDIVRRLQGKETGETVESSLVLNKQMEKLCLMQLHVYTAAHDAAMVLAMMKKDFDVESLREKNERFRAAAAELERLSGVKDTAFEKYCREKFLEYTLRGTEE